MSSEHAALLKDSVTDFVTRGTNIARVRALRGNPQEYDRALWRQMGELGWLGIAIPEKYGGMGLGLAETAIVAEGLARALIPEPFTACAVLAATALAGADNDVLKRDMLPAIASGALVPALAWQEKPGVLDSADIKVRAVPFEGGYRLSGTKRYVSGAAGADVYVVAARSDAGVVLGCLDRAAAGGATDLGLVADGRHFGAVKLEGAVVPRGRGGP